MNQWTAWMGQALITKQGPLNSSDIMTILITAAEDKLTKLRLPRDQRRDSLKQSIWKENMFARGCKWLHMNAQVARVFVKVKSCSFATLWSNSHQPTRRENMATAVKSICFSFNSVNSSSNVYKGSYYFISYNTCITTSHPQWTRHWIKFKCACRILISSRATTQSVKVCRWTGITAF